MTATRRRLLAASLGFALAFGIGFAPEAAAAPPMLSGRRGPDRSVRLALGVGAAERFVGDSSQPALPMELTLTTPPLSVSTGGVVSGDGLVHGYFELGVYFGLSVAAGVGFGVVQTPAGRKEGGTEHLFIGVPIPLSPDVAALFDGKWFAYVVPYWRPSWGPWSGTANELGFLVKISYGLEVYKPR